MLSFFKKEGNAPARGREQEVELVDDLGGGKALLCGNCRQKITTEAARIEVGGDHLHTRENPHGYRFTFGCFAHAEGCALLSEPSSEWTWFPGYLWQIENCAACGRHLGWRFQSADHTFHGLILDRMVEADEEL